jgi:two-component sensor histidine kinase
MKSKNWSSKSRAILFPLIVLLQFCKITLFSQINPTIEQIQNLIIQQNTDSLSNLNLSFLDTLSDSQYLTRIVTDSASYEDYLKLINAVSKQPQLDYSSLILFIDNIPTPNSADNFNYLYFQIRLAKIYQLRNNLLDIKASQVAYEELGDYLAQFEGSTKLLSKAKIQFDLQPVYIKMIEEDLAGKAEVESLLKLSENQKDTILIIETTLLINHFVIKERTLLKYIENAEKVYRLDNLLPDRSPYYGELMLQLINALSYAGGQEDRVLRLLTELYQYDPERLNSYSLFMQFLRDVGPKSPFVKNVFELHQVQTASALAAKLVNDASGTVNKMNEFHLLREAGMMLNTFGEYEEAINYMDRALFVYRSIYSKDLSKALATYETSIIKKEKEVEVLLANTRAEFYKLTTWIVGVLSLVILVLLVTTIRNATKLREQRNKVTNQRDLIEVQKEEKEVLLRELHHRVKNNFQIILSLMDAQAIEASDTQFQQMTQQAIHRVKVLAMVHDCLFNQEGLDLNLNTYLGRLIPQLVYSMGNKMKPELDINIPNIKIMMNEATVLGLITNELITNAIKYGFDDEKPKLTFEISSMDGDKRFEIYFHDNGNNKSNIDLNNTGLGLALIKRLSYQLGGELSFDNKEGAFKVTFSIS